MIRYDIHKGVQKIKTKTFLAFSGLGLVLGGGAMSMAVMGSAHADSIPTINFESPAYTTGNINGQQGWSKTGTYDVAVAANSSFPNASGFGFGAQSLRLSNAVTSGSFGDQTFSPGLTQPAGETQTNKHFEGSFSIGSTSASQQTGLFLSVSPDDGNGARMSYVGFDDRADGIHVIFYDVTDAGPIGTVASFNSSDVATINRTAAHTIKFSIDTVPGAGNDIVNLYVDNNLVKTGTSWENYYRYDPEQAGSGNVVPNIDKMLFRAGGSPAASTLENGYLVDNVALASTPPAPTTAKVTIVKNLNGSPATAVSANNTTFPMEATWNATNIGSGTGNYGLGPVGFNNPNPYQATTSDMTFGASYSTHELTGSTVATSCTFGGAPYSLKGYTTGNTLTAAQHGTPTMTVPSFTNLQQDKYVVVWNKTCPTPVPPPTTKDDCKNNGWKTYNNPSFKNKDKCINYVVKHGHKVKGDVHYTAVNLKREAEFNMNTYDTNKGSFEYWDNNNDWYDVKVSSVKVSGNKAYFAGVVTKSKNNHYNGNWLFAEVNDGNPDKIWGTFTNQATATAGVNAMTDPAGGSFNVTKGNLKVN